MEGIKQNSHSEENLEKIEQTDVVAEESARDSGPPPMTPTLDLDDTSRSTLEAILPSISGCKEVWPREMLTAVIERFGRMPRKGWAITRSHFNNKFQIDIPPDIFKKKAQEALVNANGRQCSSRQYKLEPAKRVRIDEYFEERTLSEIKIFNDLKVKFLSKIKEIAGKNIGEIGATRKISNLEIDKIKLDAIDRIAGEYSLRTPPKNMKDIAMIYIAAQQCYQEATEKPFVPSPWRSSIEAKIQKLKDQSRILERILSDEEIDQKSKSEAKKIMRDKRLILEKPIDIRQAIIEFGDSILVYQKKIDMHEKRKDFRKENRKFELFTRKFYRTLENDTEVEITVPTEEITEYWSTMWCEEKNEDTYDEYILDYAPQVHEPMFPSFEEFLDIIKYLPSWKAAGIDGIYNFFIKKLTTLHGIVYDTIKDLCVNGKIQEKWFYQGITYLLPKGTPVKGSDFRPITCMSNLYKLTTKCVTEIMQLEVERRGILSENQLGTVRRVQGAKEQALLNLAINKSNGNQLKTVWIDVKKAFDSVSHDYLMACIKSLNLPIWITDFIKATSESWNLEVRLKGVKILDKQVKRGILQGDSLSPLLFVLCMDPLSKKLNSKFEKVSVKTNGDSHLTNHLLFIDDLKLISTKDTVLKEMVEETKTFFKTIGLEINKEKSATNTPICQEDAKLLEGIEGYKYLGIMESKESIPTAETFLRIKTEICRRVDKLCQRPLNAVNLFQAINQYAISVMNYHVGVLKLEPEQFKEIDASIRNILMKYRIHQQPACLQRLYLPRNELGRGLCSAEFRSEQMLLDLKGNLQRFENISTRRAAILKVELDSKSHMSVIEDYIKIKYNLTELPTQKSLGEAQKKSLFNEIGMKTNHQKLFNLKSNTHASVTGSSMWLKHGNIKADEEGRLCGLQDRNLFCGNIPMCSHCKEARGTIDHLATRCDRMLSHDYTRRHNEVVRCLHLLLCNEFGIKSAKRMKTHSVQEIVGNDKVEIRVDTRIKTDTRVGHDRPDIFVKDKRRNTITLIEVGITNQDILQTVETEKLRKYDVLANELSMIHKCKVNIIPYVLTWDGVVTTYHEKYRKELKVTNHIEAYIQSKVLHKTLESVSLDFRRSSEERTAEGEDMQEVVQRLAVVPVEVMAQNTIDANKN